MNMMGRISEWLKTEGIKGLEDLKGSNCRRNIILSILILVTALTWKTDSHSQMIQTEKGTSFGSLERTQEYQVEDDYVVSTGTYEFHFKQQQLAKWFKEIQENYGTIEDIFTLADLEQAMKKYGYQGETQITDRAILLGCFSPMEQKQTIQDLSSQKGMEYCSCEIINVDLKKQMFEIQNTMEKGSLEKDGSVNWEEVEENDEVSSIQFDKETKLYVIDNNGFTKFLETNIQDIQIADSGRVNRPVGYYVAIKDGKAICIMEKYTP